MVSRIGLAQRAQRADRLPGGAPRLGVEAGGRLVEEDQLGVADQRQREVQSPQLPAGEPPAAHVGLLAQARELQHLLHLARVRVEARPVAQRLARGDVAVDAARLQHDPDPPAQLDRAARGVVPEHRHLAAVARAVPLEDLHRRGLAGAVGPEQPEHLAAAHLDVDPAHGLVLAVALVQVAHLDRGAVVHGPIIAGGLHAQADGRGAERRPVAGHGGPAPGRMGSSRGARTIPALPATSAPRA